jgi:hypothetical protein
MACEMDMDHRTLVEDKFPLGILVNTVQDTNMAAEKERRGKCQKVLVALLLPLVSLYPLASLLPLLPLLPWMAGMTIVESELALELRVCGGDVLYGRLETEYGSPAGVTVEMHCLKVESMFLG